jgi:hypothetical protein
MRRKLAAGTNGVTEPIFVADTSSSTGAGLSGLAYNTSGLVCEYRRQGQSSWHSVTLAAGTLGSPPGSSTAGTIVADGSAPGAYELGIPDNVCASGAKWAVVRLYGATNMLLTQIFYELDAVNYQDATAFGLARLDTNVGSRSIYAGGPVASVTGSVGSVTAGVALSSAGLDAVTVETMNARQALNLILDAVTSLLAGATGGASTINIKDPTGAHTRISVDVDAYGNRTAVTLSPPA